MHTSSALSLAAPNNVRRLLLKTAVVLPVTVFSSSYLSSSWATASPSMGGTQDAPSGPLRLFLADTIGKPPAERRATASKVLKQAELALENNPKEVSHHLLKVASLGAIARSVSPRESLANRYGSKSKKAIDALMGVTKTEPWGLALAGIWNIEVERRGGFVGAALLGASFEEGETLLNRSMVMLPEEPAIPFAYAVALLSLDTEAHAERSKALLATARQLCSIQAMDPLSAPVMEHGSRILELLSKKEMDAVKTKSLALM